MQIPNSKKIIGMGTSKKNAQQDAAKKIITFFKNYMNWEDECFSLSKRKFRENAYYN